MPYNPGLSFQPGSDQGGGNAQPKPQETPLQSAIKLLSLRLPSVVGARGIAPQALLQGPGSAGFGGVALGGVGSLQQLIQQLMAQSGGGGTPMQTGSSLPLPNVTPGADQTPQGQQQTSPYGSETLTKTAPSNPQSDPGYGKFLSNERNLPGSTPTNQPSFLPPDTGGYGQLSQQQLIDQILAKIPGGGFSGGITNKPGGGMFGY